MLLKNKEKNLFLEAHETDGGYSYSVYDGNKVLLDGGDLCPEEDLNVREAVLEIVEDWGWKISHMEDKSYEEDSFLEEAEEIAAHLCSLPQDLGLPAEMESLEIRGILIHTDGYDLDRNFGTIKELYFAMRDSYQDAPRIQDPDLSYLESTSAKKYTEESVEIWEIFLPEA